MGRLLSIVKKRKILFGIVMLIFLVSLLFITAKPSNFDKNDAILRMPTMYLSQNQTTYLYEFKKDVHGKNKVLFPENMKVKTARDVLLSIPSADAISYYDEAQKKTIGYVSAFGGIGKNFQIIPGRVYEISVQDNQNWTVVAEI